MVCRASIVALVLAMAGASQSGIAAVKVRTNVNPQFDFAKVRTWGWQMPDPGRVILARSQADDVAGVQRDVEPVIREIAARQMPRRGFEPSSGAADLTLTYYLLLSIGASAQTLGQFLPSVTQWGVPPFAPVSTSLELIERGSLVIDISANGEVVWRGIAEAKIAPERNRREREALLREAAEEILQRVPRRG
jgi:hypothetical protein